MLDVFLIYFNMKPNLPKSNPVLQKARPMNDLSPISLPDGAPPAAEIELQEPSFEDAWICRPT